MPNITTSFTNLIKRLMHPTPTQRPSAEKVLASSVLGTVAAGSNGGLGQSQPASQQSAGFASQSGRI